MNAAKVSAKTDVVLLVNPGGGVGGGDGLVNLKVWLLFGEAGELVQGDVRQTVEQRVLGQSVDAYLAGNIRVVGEIVRKLGIAAVPVETGIRGQPAFANGIAERQRILMRLLLTAELGEDIEFIRRRVAVVEIRIHALA